jgi:hypothetical protein
MEREISGRSSKDPAVRRDRNRVLLAKVLTTGEGQRSEGLVYGHQFDRVDIYVRRTADHPLDGIRHVSCGEDAAAGIELRRHHMSALRQEQTFQEHCRKPSVQSLARPVPACPRLFTALIQVRIAKASAFPCG